MSETEPEKYGLAWYELREPSAPDEAVKEAAAAINPVLLALVEADLLDWGVRSQHDGPPTVYYQLNSRGRKFAERLEGLSGDVVLAGLAVVMVLYTEEKQAEATE